MCVCVCVLQEDCSATFFTSPDQVSSHLTDIIEVFSEMLPLDVMMYPPDDEDMDDLPPHLRSDKVIITHTSIESAVIATTCWDDDADSTCLYMYIGDIYVCLCSDTVSIAVSVNA